MANRGFLIRFIDIGLIVLFGFIMISDIENTSNVELAGLSSANDTVEEERDISHVVVVIGPDNSIVIDTTLLATQPVTPVGSGPEELEVMLREIKRERAASQEDVVVLIQPHPRSTVQRTVDVMDVCDRLALRKSLQTAAAGA